jgi:NodT family efflux transporter outer membrane factor (OMF) lipoprotein
MNALAHRHAARRASLLRSTIAAAALATLAGCAALPERVPAAQPHAAGSYATAQTFAAPVTTQWPADAWWHAYRDPQLDALLAEALAGAPSLREAEARLLRAEASARSVEAQRAPQVSLNASANQQRQSYNYLSPSAVTPHGWNEYGRATLDFTWELDFWGRTRAALAAATSEAEATRADAAQARLVLASSIALAYAELAREHSALDTAHAALEVRRRTVDLFVERRANGLENLGSVRQVEARRAAAEADVLALDEQIALQRNRIAALMGAGPDRGLAIARPAVDLAATPGLPDNLAAELLGRRPDIVAARLRAEAAARRVDEAKASFYPNVNLLAFAGVQSLGLDTLTKNGSTIGSIGPAISLPIFDGGRLRSQLRGADAERDEAIASYDRTVVQALQDVADAVTSTRALAPQLDRAGAAVDAAREAWRIQSDRYRGGLSNYLDVLTTEDNLLANLRSLTDLQARAFTLDVALVRALGGGYAADPAAPRIGSQADATTTLAQTLSKE